MHKIKIVNSETIVQMNQEIDLVETDIYASVSLEILASNAIISR